MIKYLNKLGVLGWLLMFVGAFVMFKIATYLMVAAIVLTFIIMLVLFRDKVTVCSRKIVKKLQENQ